MSFQNRETAARLSTIFQATRMLRCVLMLSALFVNLILGFAFSPPVLDDMRRCKNQSAPVTELGEIRQVGLTLSPPNGSSIPPIITEPIRYIRLHIQVEDPTPTDSETCNWLLTVRDKEHRLVQNFSREDFKNADAQWTMRIACDATSKQADRTPRAKVFLNLKLCDGVAPPKITIDQYLIMPDQTKNPYYSSKVPNNPQYQGLYVEPDSRKRVAETQYRTMGDHVGFLMGSWGVEPNRLSWCCSGVLIAPDLFLTNWHCGGPGTVFSNGNWREFPENLYWSKLIYEALIIDFSWDGDAVSREYICTKVEACDANLDFALLRIKALNDPGKPQPVPISLAPLDNTKPIYIVHHPECMPKQNTIKDCKINETERKGWRGDSNVDFSHTCDTEGGSSGAPVFNQERQLIGIHHLGFEYAEAPTCKQIDSLNKAVRIEKIVEYLRQNHPEIYGKLEKINKWEKNR